MLAFQGLKDAPGVFKKEKEDRVEMEGSVHERCRDAAGDARHRQSMSWHRDAFYGQGSREVKVKFGVELSGKIFQGYQKMPTLSTGDCRKFIRIEHVERNQREHKGRLHKPHTDKLGVEETIRKDSNGCT